MIIQDALQKCQRDEQAWVIAKRVALIMATDEGSKQLDGARFYDQSTWDPETGFFKEITNQVFMRANMLLLSWEVER